MIQGRALGYSLSRDQVLEMYVALYPDGPVDFSKNPTFFPFHLFGETDFGNFESQFLASSLVEVGGDGARIIVSNHVYQNS